MWSGVTYKELYPGIDLKIRSINSIILPELIVRPNGNLDNVKLSADGINEIALDGTAILLTSDAGKVNIPLFQVAGNTTDKLPTASTIGNEIISPIVDQIEMEKNDLSREATVGLVYSTFFGGSSTDFGSKVVSGYGGVVYVFGETSSLNIPTTLGTIDPSYNGGEKDLFVLKLNPIGTKIQYATFIGGNEYEYAHDLTVDKSGSAYITGYTNSSNFPTKTGSFDTHFSGYDDAFVVKLNSTGSKIEYSTFLGGNEYQEGHGIAVDAFGSAYVGGITAAGFPTTIGAYDRTYNGGFSDGFLAKLNSSGTALVYSTYLGGSVKDPIFNLAIDKTGAAYVTGYTSSENFPTTKGAFDRVNDWGGFVTKFSPDGSKLVYSTFIGGSYYDIGNAIAVDNMGFCYVGAKTYSPDAPTTPGAYDRKYNGDYSDIADIYLLKLSPTGSSLSFATFLGGDDDEDVLDLALSVDGSINLVGVSYSSNFPFTSNAFDKTNNIGGFITKLKNDGSSLLYSTFIDGYPNGISIDKFGLAYITGSAYSKNFPITPGVIDNINDWNGDAFISKLSMGLNYTISRPNLVSPTNNVIVTGTPTFSWSAPTNAMSYVFQYDNNSDFSSPVYTSKEITTTKITPPKKGGTYYWHVKARSISGNWSAWSDKRKVSITPLPPPAPLLELPANGFITNKNSLVFSWKETSYSEKYQIQISSDFSFTSIEQDAVLPAMMYKYSATGLAEGDHFWRVRANNSLNGYGPWSSKRKITVNTALPDAPSLLAPKDGVVLDIFSDGVNFRWLEVSGATCYQLELATSSNFQTDLFISQCLTKPSLYISFYEGGTYFWRVRTQDLEGDWSVWSETWSFYKSS